MTSPTYGIYVDWDADGGLNIGDFELDTDGWTSGAIPASPRPALARSTVRAYHGVGSLLVTWAGAVTLEQVGARPMATFVIGRSYTMTAWVWVPSSGGRAARCAVASLGVGSQSTTTNQWEQISLTFTATATTHLLQIFPDFTATAGDQTWIDMVRVVGPGENLLATPPGVVSDLHAQYGRDQARSLQPVSPGEASFSVDNVSRALSPENSSSPLTGMLGPGRDVVVEATYNGKVYTVFSGSTDDFEVDSTAGEWLAKFTAIDGLARLKDLSVSTALHPALRTGEAIHRILDSIGWTEARDIDTGATTLRWWCADSDDTYQQLMDIVAAEGPNAFVHIGASGEFVFRDRHHRLLRAASTAIQATFRNGPVTPPDVEHDPPFEVNYGWRDIVNQAEIPVADRNPNPNLEEIWSSTTSFGLSASQSRTFTITTEDPFWAIQAPTQGAPSTITTTNPDFVVTGGTVTVALTRTSGKSTVMTVTASAALTVFSMRLRAYQVPEPNDTRKVVKQDPASVSVHRGVKPYRYPGQAINAEDANALADLIVGRRASPVPVVTLTVVNGTADQLVQQLSRDLSDRIRIVDSESGVDASFFIERIEHSIRDEGNTHETQFSCEKVPATPGNLFRFDTAGAGFNDGVFGMSGLDDPSNLFIFDTAGHGFDQGLLAN